MNVDPAELLAPGTVLGPYRIEKVLGAGGFGIVYRVRKGALDKLKAIKVLRRTWNHNEKITARFEREARALARLHDENIVQVEELGQIDGLHYFEMEFLRGRALTDALKERARWVLADALDVVLPIASGLHAAHTSPMRIVHRDLKPDNIFLEAAGGQRMTPKVIDFGVAHADDAGEMTLSGQQIGTRSYMSPEQVNSSREIDGRADQWALAVILFRMLTGRLPFYAKDNAFQTQFLITHGATPALRDDEVVIAPEAEEAMRRALQKAPADRFATMRDFGFALAPFARQETRARFEAAMARSHEGEETTQLAPQRRSLPRLETAPTQHAAPHDTALVELPVEVVEADDVRAEAPPRTDERQAPPRGRDPAEAVTVPKIAVPPPEAPPRRVADTQRLDAAPKPPPEFFATLASPFAPPPPEVPAHEPTELLSDVAVERTPFRVERMRTASKALLVAAALVLVMAGVAAVWPTEHAARRSSANDTIAAIAREAGDGGARASGVQERVEALLAADAAPRATDAAGVLDGVRDASAVRGADAANDAPTRRRTDGGFREVGVSADTSGTSMATDAGGGRRIPGVALVPDPYTDTPSAPTGARSAPAAPRQAPSGAPAATAAPEPEDCVVFRGGVPVMVPCARGSTGAP